MVFALFRRMSLKYLLISILLAAQSTAFAGARPKLKVPQLNANYWNQPAIRANNNCYNYATNRVTSHPAQPGASAGYRLVRFTCQEVLDAVAMDGGIERTKYFSYDGENDETLLALVIKPDGWRDFHFYRRDSNGLWSHKNGPERVKTVDESGNKIRSPETADRGAYTEFCGYLKVRNYPTESHEQNAGDVLISN